MAKIRSPQADPLGRTKNSPQRLRTYAVWALAALALLGLIPALAAASPHAAVAAPVPPVAPTPLAPSPAIALPSGDPSGSGAPVHLPATPDVRLGQFHLPGPHPASWGIHGVPPGWQAAIPALSPHSASWGGGGGSGGGGSSTATNWSNRLCAGLWPSFQNVPGLSSQGAYASGCYGHDEPGIQFYSSLQGSGGNVSWKVTLPTDRNPTHNQSDLYAAIWFGMTMNDPYGWMNQCFLELQFYPDQTFYNPGPLYPNWTVNGAWIGAAVAWQIESSTGYENPCFYEPLYANGVPGPAYLNMTQGDQISVQMTGYSTSTTGEQISVIDTTTGQGSNITMYNPFQGYPVNPSYRANNFPASLEWTPGGEYPVSFAFETGHAGNPSWPSNNSYGGCSGGPVSTPLNPGAPCPSYDPGSWANDTRSPWKIDPPTFFNAHATSTPVQVGFTQPEGGIDLVDQTSNGVCSGLEGSAWCSYPYYSYHCQQNTFEFGALDYPGASSNFGGAAQFSDSLNVEGFGGSFFPPTNFSIPACGSLGASVSIGPSSAGGGSVYFLSHAYSTISTVPGLRNGEYSLHALSGPGKFFAHWVTTGAVSVPIATNPYTSLSVHGSGSLRAVFTSTPGTTTVTFNDHGKGFVGVDRSFLWVGNNPGLATVAPGGTLSLAPGIYGIQAYPRPGWNFTRWAVTGPGIDIAARAFPFTYLLVEGSAAASSVLALYTSTGTNATLIIYVVGDGSATIGSTTVTNSNNPFGYNYGVATMPSGSYPVALTLGSDSINWQILYGPPLLISNNSLNTWLAVSNGTGVFEAVFTAGAPITFVASPSAGGGLSLGSGGPFTPVPSGTKMGLALGYYEVVASASPGYAFAGWSTNNSSAAIFGSGQPYTTVLILGAAHVTAKFKVAKLTASLVLSDSPGAWGGAIVFQLGHSYPNGHVLRHLAAGMYVVSALAKPNWYFAGWTVGGTASLLGSATDPDTVINLGSGAGQVTASYLPVLYAVSFVLFDPHGAGISHSTTFTINGTTVHTGATVWLPVGTYAVSVTSTLAFHGWSSTPHLRISPSHHPSAVVQVMGSGTLVVDL